MTLSGAGLRNLVQAPQAHDGDTEGLTTHRIARVKSDGSGVLDKGDAEERGASAAGGDDEGALPRVQPSGEDSQPPATGGLFGRVPSDHQHAPRTPGALGRRLRNCCDASNCALLERRRAPDAARGLGVFPSEAVPAGAPARCRHANAGARCTTVRAAIVGTLVEIRNTFLVLDGNTHIMLPPGLKVEDLVAGERLMITVTRESGRWSAECIERAPV